MASSLPRQRQNTDFPYMYSTCLSSVQNHGVRKDAGWELGEHCEEVWMDFVCYLVYEEQLTV